MQVHSMNLGGHDGRWFYIGDRVELLEDIHTLGFKGEDYILEKGAQGCIIGFDNPFEDHCTICIAFEDHPIYNMLKKDMINIYAYDPIKLPRRATGGTLTITEPTEGWEVDVSSS